MKTGMGNPLEDSGGASDNIKIDIGKRSWL
jgi:hypothetical protein